VGAQWVARRRKGTRLTWSGGRGRGARGSSTQGRHNDKHHHHWRPFITAGPHCGGLGWARGWRVAASGLDGNAARLFVWSTFVFANLSSSSPSSRSSEQQAAPKGDPVRPCPPGGLPSVAANSAPTDEPQRNKIKTVSRRLRPPASLWSSSQWACSSWAPLCRSPHWPIGLASEFGPQRQRQRDRERA